MKNTLTLAGIEPATFLFVAQHLNHCVTAVPASPYYFLQIVKATIMHKTWTWNLPLSSSQIIFLQVLSIHPSIHPFYFNHYTTLDSTEPNSLRLARRVIPLQVCPLDHCCSWLVFNFVFLLESQSNSYLKLPSVICTSTPIPTSRSPNLVGTPGPRAVRRNAVVVN